MLRPFSPATREDNLDRLADRTYDLLVIGGGITGAGIALDAAARGLQVALVERHDLAAGTSSRSSSLVHGGLRYLAQAMFGLTRESAVERDLLRRLAPHLVRPLPFVVPDTGGRGHIALTGLGMWIYDGLASFRNVARHHRLSPDEVAERIPGLTTGLGHGGYEYHDCRTDDARLVLQVARTAHRLGADVVTRAEVVELQETAGRVTGAVVRDRLGGGQVRVSARQTVSATGVWADDVRGLLTTENEPLLAPSKGVHLVFSAADVRVGAAGLVPSGAGDGRMVFLLPWGDQVIAGTTDDSYDGPLDAPTVEPGDAAYLCNAVNAAFATELTPSDAVGAWAGLRPLLASEAHLPMDSETLSRRHVLVDRPDGLLTITGGKLTTYRAMAEEAVDRVVAGLGGTPARMRSMTDRVPLGLRGGLAGTVARTAGVLEALGLDPAVAGHLVERHGDEAVEVAVSASSLPDGAEPLVPGLPYLRAEVHWAVEHEMALSVEDVLDRRTRVSLRHASAGGQAVDEVASVLARVLGWSAPQAAAEADAYRRRVARERGAVPVKAGALAGGARAVKR
ncbi:MAG TPA: glycerol-3-phosphate dehydrogenase/oxidase [Egibacteraceae bacterium]|nr:glycerol-3-phosphate dehydrogenase/oxidase [Egibacteraceae bacterium]